MSQFSRLACGVCGPESLHKLGACTTCSSAAPNAPQPTQRTGFNNETTAKTQARHKRRGTVAPRSKGLTARQQQIAALIATGVTAEEVARQFHVTRGVVERVVDRAVRT